MIPLAAVVKENVKMPATRRKNAVTKNRRRLPAHDKGASHELAPAVYVTSRGYQRVGEGNTVVLDKHWHGWHAGHLLYVGQAQVRKCECGRGHVVDVEMLSADPGAVSLWRAK